MSGERTARKVKLRRALPCCSRVPPAFDRLRALWVERVRALVAEDAAFLTADGMVSLLNRWRDFSGAFDEPRVCVTAQRRPRQRRIVPEMTRASLIGEGASA